MGVECLNVSILAVGETQGVVILFHKINLSIGWKFTYLSEILLYWRSAKSGANRNFTSVVVPPVQASVM